MNSEKIRKITPVIDYHASWIVLNPIQGCPKGCKYCFLGRLNQNRVKPQTLMEVQETLDNLLTSRFYHENIPLCFFTHTDPLGTQNNKDLLITYLNESHQRKIPNVKCFITKCPFDERFLVQLSRLQDAGEKIIIYISLSGLDSSIEVDVNHKSFIRSFELLKNFNLPVIHYWRPFFPQNSTHDVLMRVLSTIQGVAKASVAAGLKLYEDMDYLLEIWPELKDKIKEAKSAEGIWPKGVIDFIKSRPIPYDTHPIFLTNSCAISYVLNQPDIAGYFGSNQCLNYNQCPSSQRQMCQLNTHPREKKPNLTEIAQMAECEENFIRYDEEKGIIIEGITVKQEHVLNIRHKWKIPVTANNDNTYWNTSSTGHRPLEY